MSTRLAIFATALATALAVGAKEAGSQERSCRSLDPIDTIAELSSAIFACWQPPPGSAGMTLTLSFSIRKNGTLIGKPRTTFSHMSDDTALNRIFVASVLEALDKALPLPLSESMGGAIAGRPMFPRFTAVVGGAS